MIRNCSAAMLAGGLALSGCATKGYVMEQVRAATDANRAAWTTGDESVKTDVAKVRSGLDSVRTNVATLRDDLNSLRNEFGAKITAMENGLQFALPITFAFDDATVRAAARPALTRFADVITKHYPGSIVTVEGFADPAGSVAYNRRLSLNRAENVIAYLKEAGISGVTLRADGLGKTRLVAEGASRDMPGAESNRRVVFVVESGSTSTTAANAN